MESPAAWFERRGKHILSKRKKNPANANSLSCELCKIFNLGADALESHLNGKSHRTKAEQAKVAQRNKAWETAEEREIRELEATVKIKGEVNATASVPAAASAAEASKAERDVADVSEDVELRRSRRPKERLPELETREKRSWEDTEATPETGSRDRDYAERRNAISSKDRDARRYSEHSRGSRESDRDIYRRKPRPRRYRGRDDDDHSRRARYRDTHDDRGSLGSSRSYERSRRRDSYSDSDSREYRRRDREYERRRSGERYEERSEYREAGRHREQERGSYTRRERRERSAEDDSSDDAYSRRNVARDSGYRSERYRDRRRSVSVERDASGGYSSDRRTRLRRRSPERLDGDDHSEERDTRRKRTRDRGNESSREPLRGRRDDEKRRRVERHEAVSRVHQSQTGSGGQSEKLPPPSPVHGGRDDAAEAQQVLSYTSMPVSLHYPRSAPLAAQPSPYAGPPGISPFPQEKPFGLQAPDYPEHNQLPVPNPVTGMTPPGRNFPVKPEMHGVVMPSMMLPPETILHRHQLEWYPPDGQTPGAPGTALRENNFEPPPPNMFPTWPKIDGPSGTGRQSLTRLGDEARTQGADSGGYPSDGQAPGILGKSSSLNTFQHTASRILPNMLETVAPSHARPAVPHAMPQNQWGTNRNGSRFGPAPRPLAPPPMLPPQHAIAHGVVAEPSQQAPFKPPGHQEIVWPKMSVPRWKEYERVMLARGGLDALAFKVVRDIFLSPNAGLTERDVLHLDGAFRCARGFSGGEGQVHFDAKSMPNTDLSPFGCVKINTKAEEEVAQRVGSYVQSTLMPQFQPARDFESVEIPNVDAIFAKWFNDDLNAQLRGEEGIVEHLTLYGSSCGLRTYSDGGQEKQIIVPGPLRAPRLRTFKNPVVQDDVFASLQPPKVRQALSSFFGPASGKD